MNIRYAQFTVVSMYREYVLHSIKLALHVIAYDLPIHSVGVQLNSSRFNSAELLIEINQETECDDFYLSFILEQLCMNKSVRFLYNMHVISFFLQTRSLHNRQLSFAIEKQIVTK